MIRVEESAVIDRPLAEVWALLRDFNGHDRWHPAVATSHMQGGVPTDRIGGVRDFRLVGGERVCERLLTLSDRAHRFSYTITESDVPLEDYVAHVELKPVTRDGARTFWRWRSRFRTPPGREDELRELVADGVYRAGFEGARRYLAGTSTMALERRDAYPSHRPPTVGKSSGAPDSGSNGKPAGETTSRLSGSQEVRPPDGHAITLRRHGGPAELVYGPARAAPPARGEVRLRQDAIGVNFIDVYARTGYFRLLEPPAVPGMEAAGTVIDVGPGVTHLAAGDRVSYACAPPGAYASVRTMPATLVLPLPDHIDVRTAAALTLKGVTAYFLLHTVHRVQAGDTVLVYAPAGGVGRLLVQWAAHLGATVIGATSSPDKAAIARRAGAAHVVTPGPRSLEQQVRELTDGRGVDVVYDAVGRDSFDHSVAALKPAGHLVSFGQASGDIGPRDIGAMAATSLTLSRPNYGHYTDTRERMGEALDALWSAVERSIITADIGQVFPLAQAAEAHRALEARRTTGSTLLLPEHA